MVMFERRYVFQNIIFGIHVNFGGSNHYYCYTDWQWQQKPQKPQFTWTSVTQCVPATYHSLIPFGMNELGKYDCLGGKTLVAVTKLGTGMHDWYILPGQSNYEIPQISQTGMCPMYTVYIYMCVWRQERLSSCQLNSQEAGALRDPRHPPSSTEDAPLSMMPSWHPRSHKPSVLEALLETHLQMA